MARPLPQLRSPGALRGATPGRAVAPTPGATLWVLPAADPPSVAGPCPSSGRAVIPRGRSRGSFSDCEPLEGRHPALPPSGVLRGPSRPCVAVSSWALTQPGASCHRSVLRRQDGAGTSRAPEPVTPGARRGVLSVIEGHGKQNCLTQKSHPSPWPASHRRCTKEHASPGPPSPRPPAVRGPEARVPHADSGLRPRAARPRGEPLDTPLAFPRLGSPCVCTEGGHTYLAGLLRGRRGVVCERSLSPVNC